MDSEIQCWKQRGCAACWRSPPGHVGLAYQVCQVSAKIPGSCNFPLRSLNICNQNSYVVKYWWTPYCTSCLMRSYLAVIISNILHDLIFFMPENGLKGVILLQLVQCICYECFQDCNVLSHMKHWCRHLMGVETKNDI